MDKKDILLIDDDKDITEYIKIILKKEGFVIRSAFNGKEGMGAIAKKKPDLIIMDVMMSDMSEGFDLAKELKSDDRFKDIPIIISTALELLTDFDDKKKFRDWLPGDAYIEKPFNKEELVKKVKELL